MIHIFIINPFAGHKNFADNLRAKLSTFEDLNYFVFNTRYAGYETELVRKILHIFEGEKLRFYCCGGSGTMRNMLNGFDDLSRVEIAFFPCGLTNDFLKNFGKAEERFHYIEELIEGDVIKVDYIKSNLGNSLNTFSTGLDSVTVRKMNDYRIFRFMNTNMPYFMAVVYAVFIAKNHEYYITVDDKEYKGKITEVFFGNGCYFGGNMQFEPVTCVTDGAGNYTLTKNVKGFTSLPTLMSLTGKDFEKQAKLTTKGDWKKISIRRTDGKPVVINQDGDLVGSREVCEAEIVHEGLNFVVPKGVKI